MGGVGHGVITVKVFHTWTMTHSNKYLTHAHRYL